MEKNKKTNADTGKGGLRRSFLLAILGPLVLMGIIFLTAGTTAYSRAVQKMVSDELTSIGKSVLMYYDYTYEGEYSLLVDKANEAVFLKKGEAVISEDSSFIDDLGENTDSDISIFFYDTRMLTTLTDSKTKRMVGTVANAKIMEAVQKDTEGCFFNDAQINHVRYCVKYLPVYGKDGTLIGMVGVAKQYAQVVNSVRNIQIINFAIIIIGIVIMVVWMLRYERSLVSDLNKLHSFLADISKGKLDTNLDQSVLDRDDEISDMGKFTLFVRGELRKQIERDPLTKLYNRRSGQKKMDAIREKAAKYGDKYSVAIGDIDFFKKVNDTYGHDAGDAVLKEVARILGDNMMGKGTVIRWGGEEFLFVFDGIGEVEASEKLLEILEQIRNTSVVYGDTTIKFTMSIGVVEGCPDKEPADEINAADERLYFAKEHGRNRIVSSMQIDDGE